MKNGELPDFDRDGEGAGVRGDNGQGGGVVSHRHGAHSRHVPAHPAHLLVHPGIGHDPMGHHVGGNEPDPVAACGKSGKDDRFLGTCHGNHRRHLSVDVEMEVVRMIRESPWVFQVDGQVNPAVALFVAGQVRDAKGRSDPFLWRGERRFTRTVENKKVRVHGRVRTSPDGGEAESQKHKRGHCNARCSGVPVHAGPDESDSEG